MDAFIIDPARLISDIVAYVTDLRSIYQTSQQPVTDDETTLHKFCVKLETALRHEQKERYSLLGVRKDYWNFISDSIPKDDGVKFVQAIPQLRTAQGKGRAFIRYSLVKGSLADAIQRCLVRKKHLSAGYGPEAILCHPSLSTALVNKVYELNEVEFDLPCAGLELDISWPAFSRRSFSDAQGSISGRRSSVSSMTSVDLRNERPEPLVGLSSEVSELRAIFGDENSHELKDQTKSGSITDPALAEPPTITGMTLEISHLHQKILKWKADQESRLSKACNDLKQAHDDRKFASQEFELKIKQVHEKYSNLMKGASEGADTKLRELSLKLSTAVKALSEREAEIEMLKKEVKVSVASSQEAQRSAIELERKLTVSEKKQTELASVCEQLEVRLTHKEELIREFETKLSDFKQKCSNLESLETEASKRIAELQGELKAKDVVLERVQESFEKLNGMVFGSFEELESELKTRLLDREKGLESRSAENRRLETNMVEVQQQNRELNNKLTKLIATIKELENANREAQIVIQDLQCKLSSQEKKEENFLSELQETLRVNKDYDLEDGHHNFITKDFGKVLKQAKHLVGEMSTLHHQLHEKSAQKEKLEEHVAELQDNIDKKTLEIMNLYEDVDSSKKRIEFINEEKDLLEMEKVETDNKIAQLEESERSLKSNISLVVEEKSKALNELSELQNRREEEEQLKLKAQGDLAALRNQLEETVESKHKLEMELASISGTLEIKDMEKKQLDEQVRNLDEKMSACQDERIGLEHELQVARQQLEAANEARIRAEQGQVKAQEQLESLRCMMDQEIAALKFQLSSETMKYETELKCLSDQIQEYSNVKERLTEQEELIMDLESRLKDRNDTLQHDKHKYVSEIKHLRNEVQQFKSGFDENKLKIRALENELLLTAKQLEEERSRQRDLKKKVDVLEEERSLSNNKYEEKIARVKQDMEELKIRLVTVTREKAELWKKADDMEFEIKVKADDRWMDDSEVSHCLGCKAEFSFLLRKHHCRMCGRIFCNNCSDNWLQTPHSRKLRRVCRQCLLVEKKQKYELVLGDHDIEEDFRSDASDVSHRTDSVLSADAGRLDTTDISSSTQRGPNTSQSDQLEPSQSRSTKNNPTNAKDRRKSDTSSREHKYTTLKSVTKTKLEHAKSNEKPTFQKDDENEEGQEDGEYEFVDADEEDTSEGLGTQVEVKGSDIREDLVIPSLNEEPGPFWHVTIPPGKRHLIQVLVATPRVTLSWKFSTEKKSIRFGVAFKLSETKKDHECVTVVPSSQYNCHLEAVNGEIQDVSPGVYILVFDNSFSRFTSKRLFCMVQVSRNDVREDDS